jgi:hypothetical protein
LQFYYTDIDTTSMRICQYPMIYGNEKATCDFERKTLNFVLNPDFLNQSIEGVAEKKRIR